MTKAVKREGVHTLEPDEFDVNGTDFRNSRSSEKLKEHLLAEGMAIVDAYLLSQGETSNGKV